MRAYTSMTTSEFIEHLRYRAILGGMPTQVIDQIDQLIAIPSEREIEQDLADEFEAGMNDGRLSQWEADFDMLDAELTRDEQKIGLTETQIEQIKTLMIANKPCD